MMTETRPLFAIGVAVCCALSLGGGPAHAQLFSPPVSETQTVARATLVLQELSNVQVPQIPHSLLASAEAVAIVPGMMRGAFVVGLQRGHGVVLIKDEAGVWGPPQFMTITGGSVGWQVGLQATDLVLVFSSRGSVRNLTQGKITVGVDASAAAGPIGRRVSAATDLPLQAEIYSYSRSRGLFAGVSLDGSSLQMDPLATNRYYATAPPQTLPPSAIELVAYLKPFSSPPAGPLSPSPIMRAGIEVPVEVGSPAARAELLRRELAAAAARLDPLLDAQWKAYLQLPTEVLQPPPAPNSPTQPGPQPSTAKIREALQRFEAIAANPQYASLVQRPEFQQVHQLLHQLATLPTAAAPLPLPPPPG